MTDEWTDEEFDNGEAANTWTDEEFDPSDDEGDLLAELERLMAELGVSYNEARVLLGHAIHSGEDNF